MMTKRGGVHSLMGRKTRIILSCVIALVVIAGCVALLLSRKGEEAALPDTTSKTSESAATKNTTSKNETDALAEAVSAKADPSTLNSVAIDPLGVTVFYAKNTPGFEYEIKKTADGTQYVEFTAQELIGTKCTDDEGLFASIVQNPMSSEDQTTVSETVKVGNDTYGLSLAGAGCTSDGALLGQYQDGFKNGFSSLQAL